MEKKQKFNGLKCPKCGGDLIDSRPDWLLVSNPPKLNVNCIKCDYTGYRKA